MRDALWQFGPGIDFVCQHCHSVYEVSIKHVPKRERNAAICEVCKEPMSSWYSRSIPSFRLKLRQHSVQ